MSRKLTTACLSNLAVSVKDPTFDDWLEEIAAYRHERNFSTLIP
jgi:hypothetical protein